MRILTTLAAACVAFAVMGCESGESTDAMAAPGAVSEDCCGSCGGGCADKVAPGAMGECGSSCGSSCGDKKMDVAPGAVSECPASAGCASSCSGKSL